MPRTAATSAGSPKTGPYSYIVSTDGTTVYALNTTTGVVDYSGTDAGPVFRSVFTALGSATYHGAVYVKKGIYSIDSFVQASGGAYTPYYAIQIPTATTNDPVDARAFKLIGEGCADVILNITATAIATRSSGDTVVGIWQQYSGAASPTSPTGTDTEISDLSIQFPSNQRGNVHVIDLRYGSRVTVKNAQIYGHAILGPGGAIPTLAAVAGTDGSVGLRTPNGTTVTSAILEHLSVAGTEDCYDLNELTIGIDIQASLSTNAFVFGKTGSGTCYHRSTLINPIDSHNINGVTFGPTMAAGSGVDILGMITEYGTSGVFARVLEAVESTPGNSSGTVSYTTILGGTGIVSRAFWESGSGTAFLTQQSQDNTWKFGSATVPTIGGNGITTTANGQTLTNKTLIASSNVVEEITTTASSSTPTPTGGSLRNLFTVTALAAAPTFAAPSGSPTNGNYLTIRIKDDGTPRALSWNAVYRAGTDVSLPTTTTSSKTMYVGFRYNGADSKWDLVALVDGF